MFGAAMPMSNSTTCNLSEEPSTVSSGVRLHDLTGLNPLFPTILPPHQQQPQKIKKKRSLPGNPDPDAEVIALSPKTLLATNRFVCEICKKGFQRDQNLQLHRRGHNLPWKLKQRNSKEVKKRAYVCPEPSCVHHNPSRALGDLTGIKKHYCRKHGEKKWKCHKCSKIYAVHSDWKAHSKTCGTRDYRCDCGTLFSRKDSFITHRAFCDALAEESARLCSANQLGLMSTTGSGSGSGTNPLVQSLFLFPNPWDPSSPQPNPNPNPNPTNMNNNALIKPEDQPPLVHMHLPSPITNNNPNSFPNTATSAHLSATALLQKAATFGATTAEFGSLTQLDDSSLLIPHSHFINIPLTTPPPPFTLGIHHDQHLTRDFLGLTSDAVTVNVNVKDLPTDHPMTFTGDVYHHHPSLFKSRQPFGFLGTSTTAPHTWANY